MPAPLAGHFAAASFADVTATPFTLLPASFQLAAADITLMPADR